MRSELINAKTSYNYGYTVILNHGLSSTLHVYVCISFLFFSIWICIRCTLVCINLNVSISSSLTFLKAVKERQFILLQTNI